METYTIVLKRKYWFNRRLKNVIGNVFPQDMNHAGSRFMLVMFEDRSQEIVNLENFEGYTLSKELFFIEAKQVEKESRGAATVQ